MTDRGWDVIVVGAGPGGSIAALRLARCGLRPLLLDAKRFPRVKPCAGGISPRGRRVLCGLGLWDAVNATAYPIQGIRLVAPSGRETLLVGAASAIVVPRPRLDAMLAEEAVRAGAEFRDGVRAAALLEERGRTVGVRTAEGEELRSRWVIAADGANTRFSTDPRPKHLLHTCMAWYEGFPFRPHVLEMFFDRELAPHYGWLFPEGDDRVNIGVCVEADRHAGRPIRQVFDGFLQRHYAGEVGRARQVGDWRGHPIVVTDRIEHHAPPGVLLVGEACRLVNPATGEGIAYAMESGQLAADTIADGLGRGREPPDVSAKYARALRSALALRLRISELFRRHGRGLLEGVAWLGQHPLFRRLAGQPVATD